MNLDSALIHLSRVDPKLGKLIGRFGPPVFKPETNYYEALVRAIIYQQLSGKAANTIYRRFLNLFEGCRFPLPGEVLSFPHESLRNVGLSKQKATYIKDLSDKLDKGEIYLGDVEKMSDEEVCAELMKVKGIGQWTADMFLMFTLNRLDVFPLGDLGIQKGYQRILQMKKLPTTEELKSGSDIWKPYRTIAAWYLWRVVDGPFEW